MKIVELGDDNQVMLASIMAQYTQLLPFFATNSEARSFFTSRTEYHRVAVENAGQFIALVSYRVGAELQVNNLLLAPNQRAKGVFFWLQQLEKIAKLARGTTLVLTLKTTDLTLDNRLLVSGYQASGELIWRKGLVYHTALVLAGGGARGAYQIGAWRALKELGMTFDLITGTSVGALNGGLILQGDLEAAEIMWSQIDTGKILTFPGMSVEKGFSVNAVLKEMQHFAFSAVASQGVSTEPLNQLIQELLDEKKMAEQTQELFLCTTQVPQMKEVVVSFKATPAGDFHRWLLASSSFFPAMEATKIGDKYYVDGGYRNNIPVDVALANGGTELIIIDVKGPGLTKPVKIPPEVPVVTVVSPWSLGAVLLFDGSRSKWNIQLGYLETLKAFGRYIGYWYSFAHQISEPAVHAWRRGFSSGVLRAFTSEETQLFRHPQIINELTKKMRNVYHSYSTGTALAFYVLENCGKLLGITPTVSYTIDEMVALIQGALGTDWLVGKTDEEMLLSLQEWLQRYADALPLPTDKQQVIFFYRHLKAGPPDALVLSAGGLAPAAYLVAKTLLWLEMKEME